MKINIKTIWYTFVHYCQLRYDAFRLWVAIKFADAKQRAYNKRYYVIPDYNNKLQEFTSAGKKKENDETIIKEKDKIQKNKADENK